MLWRGIIFGGKEARNLNTEKKSADFAIIIPQSALSFVLELLAHDNPQLKPTIEKILEAYK